MKLSTNSIKWAIDHLDKENDTDIFPKPIEISIIKECKDDFISELSKIDIGNYKWRPSRRFIIPKDELSYRVITQLDPLDSVFLSAIIKEFGHNIEEKRIQPKKGIVFGNRFKPAKNGFLYKSDGQWLKFWKYVKSKAKKSRYVVKFDIADFYNQIYHHTIENQLIECGFPNEVKNSICNLFNDVTLKVSRGIPVGPHSTHLVAEAALIPIDKSLEYHGINYCRFMDDFIAFGKSEVDCRIILNKVAEILDKQQRLLLQRFKTEIFTREDFLNECDNQLSFEPLNDVEEKILEIVKNHTDGPYNSRIKWEDLDPADQEFFSKIFYGDLIDGYLKRAGTPNYSKLKWIYRRLRQIGVPHAVDYTINNLERLTPIINDICEYLVAAAPNYTGNLKKTGQKIHKLFDNKIIKSSDFFQIALINIFSQAKELNHFSLFTKTFNSSSENVKRKILLFAYSIKATDWLREVKEHYNDFNAWNKRAFLIASSCLPKDERKFFFDSVRKSITSDDLLEKIILKWAKNK